MTKRNGTLKLEGKPLFNASTGAKDQGQTILDSYATEEKVTKAIEVS